MPIYEYRCSDCHQVFPRLRPVGATADGVTCPRCGSDAVERLPSVFSSSGSRTSSATAPTGSCGPST